MVMLQNQEQSHFAAICVDLEEEQKNDVVHTMFKRTVMPGEVIIRQASALS